MLESLRIQNFQSHAKTLIEFDPAITTVVGSSDVGKSAIIRCLRWVCTNAPGGDAFIRHGAAGARAVLTVDGARVVRRRGKAENSYALGETVYKAFGRGVPPEIEALLNIHPTTWQGQHDAPFWFGDTPGAVSRQLNAIIDLGVIDDTLAHTAHHQKRARTMADMAEVALAEANREVKELEWVPRFAAGVEALEATATAARAARGQHAALAGVVTAIKAARAAHARHRARQGAAVTVAELCRAAGLAGKRARGLAGVVTAIKAARAKTARVVPPTAALDKHYVAWRTANGQRAALAALIAAIRTKEKNLLAKEKRWEKEAAKVPNACPTCGQSLPTTSTSS